MDSVPEPLIQEIGSELYRRVSRGIARHFGVYLARNLRSLEWLSPRAGAPNFSLKPSALTPRFEPPDLDRVPDAVQQPGLPGGWRQGVRRWQKRLFHRKQGLSEIFNSPDGITL